MPLPSVVRVTWEPDAQNTHEYCPARVGYRIIEQRAYPSPLLCVLAADAAEPRRLMQSWKIASKDGGAIFFSGCSNRFRSNLRRRDESSHACVGPPQDPRVLC
mmetsp:Transcript_13177/g.31857  ORF Transcript_13177/g.31857 Transcript_13177/m.31857 type:complete len:103 (-) Transcript_13177:8-316(-)